MYEIIRHNYISFTLNDAEPQNISLDTFYENNELRIDSLISIDRDNYTAVRNDSLKTKNSELTVNKILSGFVLYLKNPVAYIMESDWCKENQLKKIDIKKTRTRIFCTGGRTSKIFCPYISFHDDEGNQISFNIHAKGNWVIYFWQGDDDLIYIEAGLSDINLRMKPKCNETIDLFPISISFGKSIFYQRFLIKEQLCGLKEYVPVVYNSWFYNFDKFTEKELIKQAIAAQKAGAEVFVLDAGWYGNDNPDWFMNAGDWRESKIHGFKGRLKEFSGFIRDLGMSFGIWMEPERICSSSPIYKDNPHWFINAQNTHYYPDLANPQVFDYMSDIISEVINSYHVKWLKWDFNFELYYDKYSIELYSYYNHLYTLIDLLRKKHPDVVFEGCSSGAMRYDCESFSHFDCCFLSDNVNPYSMLKIFRHLPKRLATARTGTWCCLRPIKNKIPEYGSYLKNAEKTYIAPDSATWDNYIKMDLSFSLKASLLGIPGFSGDIGNMSPYAIREIKRHFDFYKLYSDRLLNSVTFIHENLPEGCFTAERISHDFNLLLLFNTGKKEEFRIKPELISAENTYETYDFDLPGKTIVRGSELVNGIELVLESNRARMIIIKKL